MFLGDFIKLLVAIVGGTSFICWAIYFSIFLQSFNPKIILPKEYLNRVYFMLIVFSNIMLFIVGYGLELLDGSFIFSLIKYVSLSLFFFLVPLGIRFSKGFRYSYEVVVVLMYFIISIFVFLSFLRELLGLTNRVVNVILMMLIIGFVFEILHFYRTRTRELMPYEIYIFLPSVTIFEFLRYVLPGDLGTNLSFFVDLSVLGYLLILSVVTVIYLIVISLNNYRTYEKSISYLNERIRDEEKLYRWFVVLLVSLIEARDPYTRSHSERVARYSYNLAKFVYKNTYMPNFIELSAFLHDIGKLGVRDEVLFYPGKLSSEYYEEMKKHPTIGKELLDSVSLFKDLSNIAYMHHERFDGLGYPRGLKGKEIPLYARIASIADSFDAMNSSRVYRNRLDMGEIFRELRDRANRQFDGNLVRIFIKNINRIA